MPRQGKPVQLHPQARIELQESASFYRNRGGENWAANCPIGANPPFAGVKTSA